MKLRTLAGIAFLVALFAFHTHTVDAACDSASLGPVSFGQSGAAVAALQTCLLGAGYAIPAGATGYYGEQTRVAVQQFYAQALGLAAWDGRSVGPQGRARLATHTSSSHASAETPVQTSSPSACDLSLAGHVAYGSRGAAVQALQECLIRAGYALPAGATGYYGEQTRAAVRAFYADSLSMPDWHGNTVGPLGRSVLQRRVSTGTPLTGEASGLRRLANAAELSTYLAEPRSWRNGASMQAFGAADDMGVSIAEAPRAESTASQGAGKSEESRVSTTNVQVAGIDEPDIVKTDGEHVFVSTGQYWYPWVEPMLVREAASTDATMPVRNEQPPTRIIDAVPAEEMGVVSTAIKETGEMLLVQDSSILIVFSRPAIVGYDVQDPSTPKELWRMALAQNTNITAGRLLNDRVYLVTETWIPRDRPCPMPVLTGVQEVVIDCADIFVPSRIEPVSHTYTLMALDPRSGVSTKKISIAGESGNTVVSMSLDNLYLATPLYSAQFEILATLMIEVMAPYLPGEVITKARTILTYEISESGKLREVEAVLEQGLAGLGPDERLRIENEAANKYQDMLRARVRDMYKTRIARVDLDTFSVAAAGEVPGRLLNQFALDEHEGAVRVAVTVDDGWGGAESVNDVYVLNTDLAVIGKVQDLGLTERIYSVRFIGDAGYLVTFRQIDPFYVLDLRVPTAPKVVGELKIPGYSAYLEPLGDDLVLGVGREGSGVKLSIFDVSNPAKPVERSKYELKDHWTEVENNHHAFLRDAEHEVFFIPGGEGGYIFSYTNGTLELRKALAGYSVKRALYIDDTMYIVSTDAIRALDENTWEEVGTLAF